MKVIAYGWKYGMNKVQLTKFQNSFLQLSLKQSKQNTDNILDEKKVEFCFEDEAQLKEFVTKLTELNVKFEIHY